MAANTIKEMVAEDPKGSIKRLYQLEMYVEALKKAVHEWADSNGDFVSEDKSVKIQKRTRSSVTLDSAKASSILEEQGHDIMDICEIKLTEESIKAKLGEVDGSSVISGLMAAGAYKKYTNSYWRIQCK
jgi:hypothetical protein